MTTSADQRIRELGLELPPAPPPGGVYQPIVISGSMLYVSGHGPVQPDGSLIVGKAGRSMTTDEAKLAARQVGLTMLSTIRRDLGGLDRIRRIVKVLGMVNCTEDFTEQPQVMNGFSELMRDVFGPELGLAARSAVGMTLPGGIAVEVEAIFELKAS